MYGQDCPYYLNTPGRQLPPKNEPPRASQVQSESRCLYVVLDPLPGSKTTRKITVRHTIFAADGVRRSLTRIGRGVLFPCRCENRNSTMRFPEEILILAEVFSAVAAYRPGIERRSHLGLRTYGGTPVESASALAKPRGR
jgi:hypothetical protein